MRSSLLLGAGVAFYGGYKVAYIGKSQKFILARFFGYYRKN